MRNKLEEFINKANIVHNYKYNYENAIFITSKTKVFITCKLHGDFLQTPSAHLSGKGCKRCANTTQSINQRSNTNDFVNKSNKIHNYIYNYDNTVYTTAKLPVIITCKIHGNFLQTPRSHLRGSGCPVCANLSREILFINRLERLKETPTIFYCIRYKNLYKIGITIQTIKQRYAKEVDNINDIEVIEIINFLSYKEAYKYEQCMIESLKDFKYKGNQLFKVTKNSEVFNNYIKGKRC